MTFNLLARVVKLVFGVNNHYGLTILELVMVMAIVALVASVIAPIYAQKGQQLSLDRSSYLLAQSFRTAIEKALSSAELQAGSRKIIPRGGYGLYIESIGTNSLIFLFADCDANKSYTPGNTICNNTAPEKIGDNILLEKGVVIQSITPGTPLNIVFLPPDPLVFIQGNERSRAEISLYHSSTPGRIKKVIVESTGLVDLE